MSVKSKNKKSIRRKYAGAILLSFLGGTLWWTRCVYHNSAYGFWWGMSISLFAWLGFRLTPARKGEQAPRFTPDAAYKLWLIAFNSMFFALFGGKTMQMLIAIKNGRMSITYWGIPRYWLKLLYMWVYIDKLITQYFLGFFCLLFGFIPALLDLMWQENNRAGMIKKDGSNIFEKDEIMICRPYLAQVRVLMCVGFPIFSVIYYFYLDIKDRIIVDEWVKKIPVVALLVVAVLFTIIMIVQGKYCITVDDYGIEIHDYLKRRHEKLCWEKIPYLYTLRRIDTMVYVLTDQQCTISEVLQITKEKNFKNTIMFSYPVRKAPENAILYLYYHYERNYDNLVQW